MKKHIFIINSYTLKNNTNSLKHKIIEYCDKEKIPYKIEINGPKRETEDILKNYQNTDYIIIPIGGDGIINRTLNCIMGTKNILGFIPLGTGNDFYKTIKETMKDGISNIDIIKINNKYCLNIACFGIDAEIANTKDDTKIKFVPKKQRYNISLIKNFFKYKNREFEIIVNGKTYKDKYTAIAACNARYYGGGFKVSPNSLVNNHILDFYMAPNLRKHNIIKFAFELKRKNPKESNLLQHIKTTEVKLICKNKITANIDGEELTDNIFNIKLLFDGIKLYYNSALIENITK